MASNVEGGPRKGSSYRRPVTGYPRGEQTRQRIIRAAVELFGNDGFDRISTRDIASRAGVRAPVLHYYFDGKEGLYQACVEQMQTHANRLLQPVIDSVRRRLAGPISRDGLIDCVCYIYDQTAEIFAREELDGGLRRQFHELLCELVGRIIGKSPRDEQTRIRVVTLGSQLSVFNHARRRALADIGWTEVNPRELQLLRATVREQTEAMLRAAAVADPIAKKPRRKR